MYILICTGGQLTLSRYIASDLVSYVFYVYSRTPMVNKLKGNKSSPSLYDEGRAERVANLLNPSGTQVRKKKFLCRILVYKLMEMMSDFEIEIIFNFLKFCRN